MSLPSILPTDGVTILWMLREGDVDSNQRRAILQRDAASDHSHPTGNTERGEKLSTDSFTMMENIIIVWRERHIVTHLPNDLVHEDKKQMHLFCSLQFPSYRHRNLPQIARIQVNIASPTVKPFNTLSYKKTKAAHHVYITETVVPAANVAVLFFK